MYRHSVDDHNNKRHSPISLEVIWATKFWPNHVFAFLLGVTKVNVNLAAMYFCGQEPTGQIKFRKLLAKTLIYNTYYKEDDDKTLDKKQKHCESGHCLITFPKNKNIFGPQIVSANSEYLEHKCVSCSKGVCTYCLCSPGVYWCAECFRYHLACTENNLSTLG